MGFSLWNKMQALFFFALQVRQLVRFSAPTHDQHQKQPDGDNPVLQCPLQQLLRPGGERRRCRHGVVSTSQRCNDNFISISHYSMNSLALSVIM